MISQNIRRLRSITAMTQEELAEQLGVARQTVAKWESGDAVPDLDNAAALAKLFGVSLDDLVHHDEESLGYPIPPRGKYIFGVVRMGERGQLVVPKRAREVFDLKPGSELLMLGDETQGIALQKVENALAMMEAYGRAVTDRQATDRQQ